MRYISIWVEGWTYSKNPSMQATVSLILIFCCVTIHASADLLRSLVVPQYAFVGGSATLTCEFDLRQSQLYSLKWYHNKTEFYRYVPTQQTKPINIKPTHKFVLHEMSRNQHRVVLNLSRLTPFASGDYRCEIIAEHPSFRTEALTASMTVLKEHLYPPVIVGVREIYDPDDVIEIECQPLMPSTTGPRPSIKWYLNGQMVAPKRLSQTDEKIGVVLKLKAQEVLDAGGRSEAECRLILGNHQEKTSKTLHVRKRKMSYVNNFFSSGSNDAFEFHALKIALLLPLFIM